MHTPGSDPESLLFILPTHTLTIGALVSLLTVYYGRKQIGEGVQRLEGGDLIEEPQWSGQEMLTDSHRRLRKPFSVTSLSNITIGSKNTH